MKHNFILLLLNIETFTYQLSDQDENISTGLGIEPATSIQSMQKARTWRGVESNISDGKEQSLLRRGPGFDSQP